MSLESKFHLYREKRLTGLWIHYNLIKPLIDELDKKIFKNSILGYSEKKVPIHSIEVGKGSIKILLWSQMHGDESTATKSMFDIFNFIEAEYEIYSPLAKLLQNCTLIFVPMINPDGAFAYTRENFKGIDINRDAVKQETKEGKLLYQLVESVQPDYAFNLHDQTSYYNVSDTNKAATLSFLSPAADKTKKLTKSRQEAMAVIVTMFQSLQKYLPNQIGRYTDNFCQSCFGDTIQMMSFPTILIESGYFPNDKTREKTRMFHFIALMNALFAIASGNLPDYNTYLDIPLNEKNYYDVLYKNCIYNNLNTSVAIRYKYLLKKGILVKEIDSNETIYGDNLKGKLFHKTLDAKGGIFSDFS